MKLTDRLPTRNLHGLPRERYVACYNRGWAASGRPSADLGRNPYAPERGEEAAWEDGYLDRAVRPRMKWVTPLLGYYVASAATDSPTVELAYALARHPAGTQIINPAPTID